MAEAEPSAALEMVEEIPGLGAHDLGSGQKGSRPQGVRARAAGSQRHPAYRAEAVEHVDRRTSRQAGYAISQTKRKRVEEIFGWLKSLWA